MPANVSEIVRQLLDGMHTMSKTETIVGEPIRTGDATIVPVHRLRVGFAAAAASGRGHAAARQGQTGGRGTGGGVQIDPVAVIAVGRDGTPRVLAVDGEAEGGLLRVLDQVPDLVLRAVKAVGDRVLQQAPPAGGKADAPALGEASEGAPAKAGEKTKTEKAK